MADSAHNYGPSCLLHTDSNSFIRRASRVSIDPPAIRAQFFYCSSLPIDDPLSPVPPPQTGAAKASRLPPRPFSIHDNRALEEAWLRIHEIDDDGPEVPEDSTAPNPPVEGVEHTYNEKTMDEPSQPRKVMEELNEPRGDPSDAGPSDPAPADGVSPKNTSSGSVEKHTNSVMFETKPDQEQSPDNVTPIRHTASARSKGPGEALWEDPHRVAFEEAIPVKAQEIMKEEAESGLKKVRSRSRSPFRWRKKAEKTPVTTEKPSEDGQSIPYRRLSRSTQRTQDNLELGSSPAERDITGTPFLRAPSRSGGSGSSQRSIDPSPAPTVAIGTDGAAIDPSSATESSLVQPAQRSAEHASDSESSQQKSLSKSNVRGIKVVTGISRLHVVEMPSLKVLNSPIEVVKSS